MENETYEAPKVVIEGELEVKAGSRIPAPQGDIFYDLLDDEL